MDFAPTGRLRAALNFGNRVLVGRDFDGQPTGITVDLAAELARSLELDLELIDFERAVDVANAADQDAWDICFLAVDPARSQTIGFTAPYIRISGCYLASSRAIRLGAGKASDVPEAALRVGVVEGSAYTLFLSRQPGADNLIELPTLESALVALDDGTVDAIAGIEQVMAQEASRRPGSKVLQPPFMEIRQAIGVPATRGFLVSSLQAWLSELRRSGRLGGILERNGVSADCAL